MHTELRLVENHQGRQGVANHLRAVVEVLIDELNPEPLPEGLASVVQEEVDRIREDLSVQPDEYYQLEERRRPLEKDIAICAGGVWPIGGAWLVEERWVDVRPRDLPVRDNSHGQSRGSSVFVSNPLYQAARMLKRRVLVALGWRRRCFVVHTVERRIRRFSASEQEKAFRNLAELVAQRPEIDGIYRSSWFLDPAAVELTPGLAFLASLPSENGAVVWASGLPDEGAIEDAVGKSGKRKAAYERGEYTPRIYSYIWPRDAFLKWASGK